MFKVDKIDDKTFLITCDKFDARLLQVTIVEDHKNVIEFCMSIVKAAVKGAKLFLYPTG